ncbi:MAG: hypothetical protein Q8L44_01320 [Sulfuritalea sp.]|nr:hypothetical protein [Sulfuritalea sp.]
MKNIAFAFLLAVVSIAAPANAALFALPGSVGEMISDDSSLARIKDAEIGIEQLGEDAYLVSLKNFPRTPNMGMETIGASSRVAACLADYLAFQHKKSSWSVGLSMRARDEFYEKDTRQLDYYLLIGRKPDKSLKDKTGRAIDNWNHPHGEYGLHLYAIKKGCEQSKFKPEWLSSWETYRAPVSYSNVGGARLPSRISEYYKKTLVDEMSKKEEMLPIVNAAVLLREIDPKLYALRVTFDEPVHMQIAMWSLMFLPFCLTDHMARMKGFRTGDIGYTDSGVGRLNDKSADGSKVFAMEYLLLLDVRENDRRPVVAGFEKVAWIGASSLEPKTSPTVWPGKHDCGKMMADEFVGTR